MYKQFLSISTQSPEIELKHGDRQQEALLLVEHFDTEKFGPLTQPFSLG